MSVNPGRQRGFKRNKMRMDIVRQLAELGLTNEEISSVGNYSLQTVANDVRIFKKNGQITGNRQSQNFDFRLFFKFFARLFLSPKRNDFEAKLLFALSHTNAIKRLNTFAQSLEFVVARLLDPFEEEDYKFKKLYSAIFGLQEPSPSVTHKKFSMSLIGVLEQVNRNLEIDSEMDVKNLLLKNLLEPSRPLIAIQQWHHDAVASRFEDALNLLPEKESEIIRLHYGIGDLAEQPLQEVSRKMDLSLPRVAKLESKAIKTIRKCPKAAELREIKVTVGELKDKFEKARVENTHLWEENTRLRAQVNYLSRLEVLEEEKLDVLSRQEKILSTRVEELGISVRAYNCCDRAKIVTVRDLVQKKEEEMLMVKNFGQGTLREMKLLLRCINESHEIELHFGMKF